MFSWREETHQSTPQKMEHHQDACLLKPRRHDMKGCPAGFLMVCRFRMRGGNPQHRQPENAKKKKTPVKFNYKHRF